MTLFTCILLGFLVICAVAASLSKSLLNTILIFMSYSLVMSIIWILLEAPDLAITEAAVGAGVTTVLFLLTLKKIHAIIRSEEGKEEGTEKDGGRNPEQADEQEEQKIVDGYRNAVSGGAGSAGDEKVRSVGKSKEGAKQV